LLQHLRQLQVMVSMLIRK